MSGVSVKTKRGNRIRNITPGLILIYIIMVFLCLALIRHFCYK